MFVPESRQLRLEVVGGKDVIGQPAMAAYGFEEGTKEIIVEPGKPNSVTLMLTGGSFPSVVTLRATDSKTEAVLATQADVPLNLAL
jgi:hypothetical protein